VYVVYLPVADGKGKLDLSNQDGSLTRRWYNPRTGEFAGASATVQAGQSIELAPPEDISQDWVVCIRRGQD
jgi:hypothetical protein